MYTPIFEEYQQIYYLIASIVTFVSCLLTPSRLKPSTNFFGSLMVALILGWLLWPIGLYCVFYSRRTKDIPFKAVNTWKQ